MKEEIQQETNDMYKAVGEALSTCCLIESELFDVFRVSINTDARNISALAAAFFACLNGKVKLDMTTSALRKSCPYSLIPGKLDNWDSVSRKIKKSFSKRAEIAHFQIAYVCKIEKDMDIQNPESGVILTSDPINSHATLKTGDAKRITINDVTEYQKYFVETVDAIHSFLINDLDVESLRTPTDS